MLDKNVIEIWEVDINKQNLERAKENINNLSKLEIKKLKGFKYKKDYQITDIISSWIKFTLK